MELLNELNINSGVLIWVAIGFLLIIGFLIVNDGLRKVARFGLRAVFGAVAIFVINFGISSFGFGLVSVGLNVLTISIAAFLGVPGIAMLYSLMFIV